jgi:hypothetical protein
MHTLAFKIFIMKELKHELFDALGLLIDDASQLEQYNLKQTHKANPSDGSGARFGNKAVGMELQTEVKSNCIATIFLHNDDGEKFTPFAGELPNGITMDMDRKTIVKKMGKPAKSWEIEGSGIFAILNAADKWFNQKGDAIRIEYVTDESHIRIISLSSAANEERFK